MEVEFSKIHGLGNDFIVVDELQKEKVNDKEGFSKKYCKRHTSIGADGVLFMCKSDSADFKMRIFNADGSEAENCVNGLRCVALQKFLLDGKEKSACRIETLAGNANARIASFENNRAVVEIDFLGKKEFKGKNAIEVSGKKFEYFFVDVGNPHAIVFLDAPVQEFPVEKIGHEFENHRQFYPNRINTEFVNIVSKEEVNMRVHERGACETLACGSGSIAIVIAGVKAGLLEAGKWISVRQPGGTIEINFDGKNVLLKALVEKAFDGKVEWGC